MRKKKPPKPKWYWGYWGFSYLLIFTLFWKKIGSGLFSIYILIIGFAAKKGAIIQDINMGLLDGENIRGLFFFSLQDAVTLLYLGMAALCSYAISIFIVAQFALPVSRFEDRSKAAKSFFSFIIGSKRLAIFVKEGGKIESHGESEDASGGVILADLSSAVALAQQQDVNAWDINNGVEDELEEQKTKWEKWNQDVSQKWKSKKAKDPFVDPVGPGLTFIKKGQKIISVLDLRTQSRSEKITAYMRNGIQVSANLSVTFSLSADPEIIYFGWLSDAGRVKLRWLDIDENRPNGESMIRGYYELDDQDASLLKAYTEGKTELVSPPESTSSASNTPYKFYKERVFNAASSNARSAATGNSISWHEAPLDAAKELFRGELLTVPYDDLYSGLAAGRTENPEVVKQSVDALNRLREVFSRKMKLKGEILFQYVENKDHVPFHKGGVFGTGKIIKYAPIRLIHQNLNSLRSVGVVIKAASFGNLQPSSEDIKKRLVANWKARWEKEVEFINAQHELESVRIKNRNRAQIQQEMTHLLSSIFQSSHTDEALALRVFQALEQAAVNPGSENDITPREVVDMLDSLHRWLLVDRKDLFPEQDDDNNHNKNGKIPPVMNV
ncbi:MAG: hypothetical protein KDD74_10225 [Anaerolineales bacterium]|nr:hypothetical protein [Anaerolineales bacterium]